MWNEKWGSLQLLIMSLLLHFLNEAYEELQAIKLKLAVLKDQSLLNNIKFCGVSGTVPASDLRRYVQQMISTLLPEREVIVYRAHRLPKPLHLPDTIPRDVIAIMLRRH